MPVRRNPDIVHLVHNNMVYGLTQGQASPTSRVGFKTLIQVNGVINEPLNPIMLAISLGATFVARTFVGNNDHTREIIKSAVRHKGYALIDIFDPCVSFNKSNTFKWYKENTYIVDESYDPSDKIESMKKGMEENPFALGIIYRQTEKPVLEEQMAVYADDKTPLYLRKRNPMLLNELIM